MRLPRDLTGARLVKALEKKFGYTVTRQTGSHIRLRRKTCTPRSGSWRRCPGPAS
ncbi:MAG: type II toxin-antitoxin system HicA family toxin [Proteobacteria bacterium]|nr:type II toxin-antitoxin system HicA family toxin [Pseudomonadota bacterium]